MTAVDYVAANVENVAQQNAPFVAAFCHDLTTNWPFSRASFDFAIDTFCFKHFISEKDCAHYCDELLRVLKPKAFYLLTLAGRDDAYYSQQGAVEEQGRLGRMIVDSANQIASRLYAKEEIVEHFSALRLVDYQHKTNSLAMHGKVYPRSTHLFVFEKE